MRGGAREGAGRPKAEPTVLVRLRLTPAQYKAYVERGEEHWLKRILSEPLNSPGAQNPQAQTKPPDAGHPGALYPADPAE